jgi:integrase
MTYRPEEGMTERQIQKELKTQEVMFEQSCKQGNVTSAVKFETFARQWFDEVAILKLKPRTISNYKNYSKRVFKAIGHKRMDKINPRDIQRFILDLSEGGRGDKYRKGKLAPKTVKNYVAFISTVYEHAIKMQVVSTNPCRVVTLPKSDNEEREIYSLEGTQQILELLHQEDAKNFHFTVYFTLAVYTGFRRGELLGLEFKDIDFNRQIVSVRRTSNYTKEKGVFTDTPKTRTSYRALKLPPEIMDLLSRYKANREDYARNVGDKWVDTDRLFTMWSGEPMFPNTPSLFFGRFCKRHGIKYLNIHSFRHLNASIQINAGVDVKAVQTSLGHSTATTTVNTQYGHTFFLSRKLLGAIAQ